LVARFQVSRTAAPGSVIDSVADDAHHIHETGIQPLAGRRLGVATELYHNILRYKSTESSEACKGDADNRLGGTTMTLRTLPATSHWNLFKVQGQLDFAAAPAVVTALMHAAQLDKSHLLIDLEDLASVDEIGVAKLTATVQRLMSERPSLHVAFLAKDALLAEALARAQLPSSVTIFRDGSEALKAIGLSAAA
jgi:hypothetical protein